MLINAVKVTRGSKARLVMLERLRRIDHHQFGVIVAREIELEDHFDGLSAVV